MSDIDAGHAHRGQPGLHHGNVAREFTASTRVAARVILVAVLLGIVLSTAGWALPRGSHLWNHFSVIPEVDPMWGLRLF